ncbi:MAG TPA: cation:proton antiporter [Longimicrobiaceae bacterium]|nr:cation:proton antiporter [Longimicrobiaceae bacterium]
MPHLPITNPVEIVALAMVIFLVVPLVFERFRVPGMIGIILAGAVVGPNGLNLLARDATIVLLGTVGLLYLMFLVGLELDLVDFNKYRNRSVVFGALSFAIPQITGTSVGLAFGYSLPSALLLGAVFASHTVLAYPIASRLGIVKNLAVTSTLGGTILTETLALLVLAVVARSIDGALGISFWVVLVGSLAVYILAVLLGVPRLGRWFFRKARSEATSEFIFVMATLFAVAFLAEIAGVEPIIGALLAGLALNRLVPEHGTLMNRINFVGSALFIPFFLLSVGMLVDVRALATLDSWILAAALAAGVIVSKGLAALATRKAFGYSAEEAWVVFGLSVPHASGTLAIVIVGFQVGLFDQAEVNGVVLTILTTSLIGPWMVEKYGRRVALKEEQKPYAPSEAPQRILIPISNPATAEALLDLAFMMRSSDEPIYPLMVVREMGNTTDAQVAETEKMLGHAVIHAASAEVPVVPLTRVDQNIATGIMRGIAETRTSMVVVGWDGGGSTHAIFGSVLDHLLDQVRQGMVVAKLGHPLNTTTRLVLILPALIHRHPGFHDAARNIKLIANQLGASILSLVVDGDADRYQELFNDIKPAVPTTFESAHGWGALMLDLRKRVKADDLVVAMSARRGTLPWHPKLERLPSQLAGLLPESFLIVYPGEADTSRREEIATGGLPRGLVPERIVFDLPSMPFEEALERLLATGFSDRSKVRRIADLLVQSERQFSTEVRPGVIVPHARVNGLDEPLLFLGTSPAGIDFPQAREPARLIFVLLSPASRPQAHLNSLAEIARLVSNEEKVEELIGSGSASPAATARP